MIHLKTIATFIGGALLFYVVFRWPEVLYFTMIMGCLFVIYMAIYSAWGGLK